MKTIIIENESHSLILLKTLLQDYIHEIEILGESDNIQDGILLIKEKQPDLIFLDIELNDGTGFDLLAHFGKPQFKVIFVTSHEDYAIRAIKNSALDYILKPISKSDLSEAIDKFKENYQTAIKSTEKQMFDIYKTDHFILKEGGNYGVYEYSNISYFTTDRPYTKLILSDGKHILTSETLSQLTQKLPDIFYQIHKSFIINIYHIKTYNFSYSKVTLKNDLEIPIAFRRRLEFRTIIQKYLENHK